jgi:hypothetical protein
LRLFRKYDAVASILSRLVPWNILEAKGKTVECGKGRDVQCSIRVDKETNCQFGTISSAQFTDCGDTTQANETASPSMLRGLLSDLETKPSAVHNLAEEKDKIKWVTGTMFAGEGYACMRYWLPSTNSCDI